MDTQVRQRTTHHLVLGVSEDSATKIKYVHCKYPNGVIVFGPNATTTKHPDTLLSVSLQEDIVWESDQPFSIELNPRDVAMKMFFRNKFPWYSIHSPLDHLHRVHSGALDPDALPLVEGAVQQRIVLKFTATQLDAATHQKKAGVEILDPHVIIEP